jgi:hypothetical protein
MTATTARRHAEVRQGPRAALRGAADQATCRRSCSPSSRSRSGEGRVRHRRVLPGRGGGGPARAAGARAALRRRAVPALPGPLGGRAGFADGVAALRPPGSARRRRRTAARRPAAGLGPARRGRGRCSSGWPRNTPRTATAPGRCWPVRAGSAAWSTRPKRRWPACRPRWRVNATTNGCCCRPRSTWRAAARPGRRGAAAAGRAADRARGASRWRSTTGPLRCCRPGSWPRRRPELDRIGRSRAASEEQRVLRDRANLTLALAANCASSPGRRAARGALAACAPARRVVGARAAGRRLGGAAAGPRPGRAGALAGRRGAPGHRAGGVRSPAGRAAGLCPLGARGEALLRTDALAAGLRRRSAGAGRRPARRCGRQRAGTAAAAGAAGPRTRREDAHSTGPVATLPATLAPVWAEPRCSRR